jgi:hypothetical protein
MADGLAVLRDGAGVSGWRAVAGSIRARDLAVLFLLSVALRFIYVWSVAEHPAVYYPIVDSRAYHEKALRILGGDWLGDRVFFQDPGSGIPRFPHGAPHL